MASAFEQASLHLSPKVGENGTLTLNIQFTSTSFRFLCARSQALKDIHTFKSRNLCPRGGKLSSIVRTRYSGVLACLKKECLRSFSAVGRLAGFLTRHIAIISLKAYNHTKKELKNVTNPYNFLK
jgi:hypothetical protein